MGVLHPESSAFLLDGRVERSELRDRYVFWAIDGVLAPYRFNGHVTDPESGMGAGPDEVKGGFFWKRKPSPFMQSVSFTCGAREQFAVERVFCAYELNDKISWLSSCFPEISVPLFFWWDKDPGYAVTNEIVSCCVERRIPLSDAVYVGASIDCVCEAEKRGIRSFHISSFLDFC